MLGFTNRASADLPHWAGNLKRYYWIVRVEGRDKAKRRSYYRKIRKERLRLVEMGIEIEKVNAVCRYLVSLKQVNADRLHLILESDSKQLSFNFY